MIYDMPPVLQGTPQQQLQEIRNYLVRLARQQQQETSGAVVQNGTTVTKIGGKKLGDKTVQEEIAALEQRAQSLRSLIKKTADETYMEAVNASESIMQELYVAQSDFGTVQEEIYTRIEETARQIRESFNYEQLVRSIGDVEQYITLLNGEIRRGFIEVNGVINFGIAISSNNVFASNETEGAQAYDSTATYEEGECCTHEDGNGIVQVYRCALSGGITIPEAWTAAHWKLAEYQPEGETNVYYEINTGGCFGLYTATGWQFWKKNQKLGWFDISDGQLHVNNINIEANLIMGQWRLTNNGSAWGLKYVGA